MRANRANRGIAVIMLLAGACVGGPIAQLWRGERPDFEIIYFILGTHVFAVPLAYRSFIVHRNNPAVSMDRVMVALGYLAGIGCGMALVVT